MTHVLPLVGDEQTFQVYQVSKWRRPLARSSGNRVALHVEVIAATRDNDITATFARQGAELTRAGAQRTEEVKK